MAEEGGGRLVVDYIFAIKILDFRGRKIIIEY